LIDFRVGSLRETADISEDSPAGNALPVANRPLLHLRGTLSEPASDDAIIAIIAIDCSKLVAETK
jgi:hypothetical protein